MANSFCRHISNSYRFSVENGELFYQPCCWVPFNEKIDSKESLEYARKETSEKILRNTRRYCHECLNREQTGYRPSGRQMAIPIIPEDANEGDSYTLEMQVDTNCNAACTICGPHFSSLWRKQIGIMPATIDTTHHYNKIINLINVDTLRQVKFFGGEPLLTDSHLIILNNIPDPSVVSLFYSTNGSIEPSEEVINIWKKFQKVNISFSIDATKDRFTFIRWPLKWSRVESNLINLTRLLKNVIISVHTTINPLSAWYIDEIEDWVNHISLQENIKMFHSFSPCHGTWGINGTPASLRKELCQKYSADHSMVKMLGVYPEAESNTVKLVDDLINLDSIRSQSWQDTFPEVAHHFLDTFKRLVDQKQNC